MKFSVQPWVKPLRTALLPLVAALALAGCDRLTISPAPIANRTLKICHGSQREVGLHATDGLLPGGGEQLLLGEHVPKS